MNMSMTIDCDVCNVYTVSNVYYLSSSPIEYMFVLWLFVKNIWLI
jgi:hypothetical protein